MGATQSTRITSADPLQFASADITDDSASWRTYDYIVVGGGKVIIYWCIQSFSVDAQVPLAASSLRDCQKTEMQRFYCSRQERGAYLSKRAVHLRKTVIPTRL